MKLTAQEIMRYGAETEREETLINYIEAVGSIEDAEEELDAAGSRIDELVSFIEHVLQKFEDEEEEDFLEFMRIALRDNPL